MKKLWEKLKGLITPLKAAFILSLMLHAALFNWGKSLCELNNSSIAKDSEPQKVSFKRATEAASPDKPPASKAKADNTSEKANLKETEVAQKKQEKENNRQIEKTNSKEKKSQEILNGTNENRPEKNKENSKSGQVTRKKEKDESEKRTQEKNNQELKKSQLKEKLKENPTLEEIDKEVKLNKKLEEQSTNVFNKNQNKPDEKQNNSKKKQEETSSEAEPDKQEERTRPTQNQIDLTTGSHSEVEAPSLLEHKSPTYPKKIKERGIEGKVVLKILINRQGRVDKLQIHKSSGYKKLDSAAKRAVSSWQFKPAKKKEQKIGSWILVPIKFRLQR